MNISNCAYVVQLSQKLFIVIIVRVFCPRAGPSLQEQESRLQFYRRQVSHLKLRNQSCSFTRDEYVR